MDKIEINRITARALSKALSSELKSRRALQSYLLCKAALVRRRKSLASLAPQGQPTANEQKMIDRLERSLEAHKRNIELFD